MKKRVKLHKPHLLKNVIVSNNFIYQLTQNICSRLNLNMLNYHTALFSKSSDKINVTKMYWLGIEINGSLFSKVHRVLYLSND